MKMMRLLKGWQFKLCMDFNPLMCHLVDILGITDIKVSKCPELANEKKKQE